jgi:S1-C subfamily serine protease
LAVYLTGGHGAPAGWRVRLAAGAWAVTLDGDRPRLVRAEEAAGALRLEVGARAIVAVPGVGGPAVTVNGQPLDGPQPLKANDRLALDAVELLLQVTTASTPTELPAAAPGVALPPPDPPKWRPLVGLAAVAAVAVAMVLAWKYVAVRQPQAIALVKPEVRQMVGDATVWVRSVDNPEGTSEGSGVVLKRGYVVTNAHVLNGGHKIKIIYRSGTTAATTVDAAVVRVGEPGTARDIALLKVETGAVRPLPLADLSRLPEGTPVAAYGFPLGSDLSLTPQGPNISVRGGTVTALRRDGNRVGFVETDVPAEVGNSGGPVVTAEGAVIGLATMIAGPNLKVALCVSAEMIHDFAPELSEN